MSTTKKVTGRMHYDSFGDWLRMEDAITKHELDKGTVTSEDLELQVISDNETWEYILDKCVLAAGEGRITLDLSNCMVCASWTCPAFWELVRSESVESVVYYTEDTDETGAYLVARLTGTTELFARKVKMLSRLYVDDITVDAPNIYMKKDESGYSLYLQDAFGASGVISIADYMLLERSLKALRGSIDEGEIIQIDLRPYDIGMVADRVSKMALMDKVNVLVSGVFLGEVLRGIASIRAKQSGLPYNEYAQKKLETQIGSRGILIYDKTSRGYSLPARLISVGNGVATFEVISPINGSCTDYRKFKVEVNILHLSFDDILAKPAGYHVFISERYLGEDVVENILEKGFTSK